MTTLSSLLVEMKARTCERRGALIENTMQFCEGAAQDIFAAGSLPGIGNKFR